jgi:hypothetical protein
VRAGSRGGRAGAKRTGPSAVTSRAPMFRYAAHPAILFRIGGVSSRARRRQGVRVGSRGPGETPFRRGGYAGAKSTGPRPEE